MARRNWGLTNGKNMKSLARIVSEKGLTKVVELLSFGVARSRFQGGAVLLRRGFCRQVGGSAAPPYWGMMLVIGAGLVCVLDIASARGAVPGVEHLVIIGCDGMSPNGVQTAATPVMHRLMSEGAWSLHTRGVMPTVSSPNWASMIMGAGPEQHGVASNDWETNKPEQSARPSLRPFKIWPGRAQNPS